MGACSRPLRTAASEVGGDMGKEIESLRRNSSYIVDHGRWDIENDDIIASDVIRIANSVVSGGGRTEGEIYYRIDSVKLLIFRKWRYKIL